MNTRHRNIRLYIQIYLDFFNFLGTLKFSHVLNFLMCEMFINQVRQGRIREEAKRVGKILGFSPQVRLLYFFKYVPSESPMHQLPFLSCFQQGFPVHSWLMFELGKNLVQNTRMRGSGQYIHSALPRVFPIPNDSDVSDCTGTCGEG